MDEFREAMEKISDHCNGQWPDAENDWTALGRAAVAFGKFAVEHMNGPERAKAIEAACAAIDLVDMMQADQ